MVPHPIEGAAADIVHPGIDDILVLSFDYTLLLHFLILLLRDMEVVERKLDVLEGTCLRPAFAVYADRRVFPCHRPENKVLLWSLEF